MIDAYENDPDISNEDWLKKHNRHLRGRCSVLWEALHEANEMLCEEVGNRLWRAGGDKAWAIAKIGFFDEVLWDSPKNMPSCDKKKRKELREERDRPEGSTKMNLETETCATEMLIAARRAIRLLEGDEESADARAFMARKLLSDALKDWS